MSSTIELPTADGPMPTYVAEPDGTPRAGVVVVQEAFGITGHIQRVAEDLASAGYLAVAPALFHRSGAPVLDYGDLGPVRDQMALLGGDAITTDVDAALAHLVERGFSAERQGIIGFCMGGSITLATAGRRTLGAAVTFYGGGLTEARLGLRPGLEDAADLRTPWLGFYGDRDAGIPVEAVEQLRQVVQQVDVPAEVVRYAEADHGFHCDERDAHHPPSSADAWQRTLAFLASHLG